MNLQYVSYYLYQCRNIFIISKSAWPGLTMVQQKTDRLQLDKFQPRSLAHSARSRREILGHAELFSFFFLQVGGQNSYTKVMPRVPSVGGWGHVIVLVTMCRLLDVVWAKVCPGG